MSIFKLIESVTESKVMPRGGARPGAGSKPKWNHGKTKTIRVPVALVDEIIAIAKKLDDNGCIESATDSNKVMTIDLAGLPLSTVSGEIAIKLSELVKKGYSLKPDSLNRIINNSLARK